MLICPSFVILVKLDKSDKLTIKYYLEIIEKLFQFSLKKQLECNEMDIMDYRSKVFGLVEVVLRVPPLFVIDEILKIGLGGFNGLAEYDLSDIGGKFENTGNGFNNVTSYGEQYDPVMYKVILMSIIRLLVSTLG